MGRFSVVGELHQSDGRNKVFSLTKAACCGTDQVIFGEDV